MTDNKFNDRPLAIFFSIVALLGFLPGVFGMLVAIVEGFYLSQTSSGNGSTRALACYLFVCVNAFGFWLLPQYLQRARRQAACVPKATLWRLSAVNNGLLLAGSVALYAIDARHVVLQEPMASVWFAFLFGLALYAAIRSADASPAGDVDARRVVERDSTTA